MAKMKICIYCRQKIDYGKECTCDGQRLAAKSRNKYYDKNVRQGTDKQYTDFYHSKAWYARRDYIKKKYYGMCLGCWKGGKQNANRVLVVHHIKDLKQYWNLRLDNNNLIPLCRECHESDKHNDVEYWIGVRDEWREIYN